MPWVPEGSSAKTWSSRDTSFAESYTGQGAAATSWPIPSAVDPCRESLAEVSAIALPDGGQLFAFQVGMPADWCVDVKTFVTISSGFTL